MEEISLLYNNKKFCLKIGVRNKHPKELKELKGRRFTTEIFRWSKSSAKAFGSNRLHV